MMYYFRLLAVLIVFGASLVRADGGATTVGGAGDGCVADFKTIALQLSRIIYLYPSISSALKSAETLTLVRNKLISMRVSSDPRRYLEDPVTGFISEAINNGDDQVVLGQFWCSRNLSAQKIVLVFHEALSMVRGVDGSRIERSQEYSVSGLLFSEGDKLLRFFEAADSGTSTPENFTPQNVMSEPIVGIAGRFISVPAGEFLMGSPDAEEGRMALSERLHVEKIVNSFELQATEVTELQYFLVMQKNPSISARTVSKDECDFGNKQFIGGEALCVHHPVTSVSWDDVQIFIGKLNHLQNQYIYRLPSEAEWEYAARAGSSASYSFGPSSGELDQFAWYFGNSNRRTHAVGRKKANSYGFFDMHGNVWEWVQDFFSPSYDLRTAGNEYVMKGGSATVIPRLMRSASRVSSLPFERYDDVGFRLARTPRKK